MDGDWELDWVNYYSFTASSSGTIYIMVYPYYEYDTGTFAIVYNTTGSQPAMSVSFIAPFSAKVTVKTTPSTTEKENELNFSK
jgi:hypothetical protein